MMPSIALLASVLFISLPTPSSSFGTQSGSALRAIVPSWSRPAVHHSKRRSSAMPTGLQGSPTHKPLEGASDEAIHASEIARLHYAAWRQIKQDRLDRARTVYLIASITGDSSRTFLLWALLEQRAGHPDESRNVFRAGVERHPMDSRLVTAWGLLESKLGKAKRASLLLKRSVQLNPQSRVLMWTRIGEITLERQSVVSPTGDVMRPRWALGKGGTRALHYDHASVPLDLRNSDPRRWVRDEEGRLFEAWKAERDALTAVRGVTTARRRSVSAGLPRNLSGESVEEN